MDTARAADLRVAAARSGVSIEDISHLVGHSSTVVTEKVYRKELRRSLPEGADYE